MWISTINSFYVWANHNHLFADTEMGDNWNPIADIGKPRLHPRSPRPMPSEDIRRAVELADPRDEGLDLVGRTSGAKVHGSFWSMPRRYSRVVNDIANYW